MSKTQKTIVITGATAGIGRHAALYLAERGHHVIATGRREGALKELASEARTVAANGGRLDAVRLDVTDSVSIRAARIEVEELVGDRGVDVLINNAGYGQAAPLSEATDADIRKQFETNVFGLMAVTRAFLGSMIKRRTGRVINVSSIGGRITFPMMGVYHASKYAVEALSDALRMELAPLGIHVSIIEPGPIQTNFVATLNNEAEAYRQGSLYSSVFEVADKVEAQAMAMAPGPKVISRAIYQAVTARRPKARYVAPLSAHLRLKALQLVPLRLRDWIMRAMFGLTKKRLSSSSPEEQPALQAA
jgi:short-subunit dehydrogenase